MDLRQLKQVYSLGPEHIPAGSAVVEISGWDSEPVTYKENGRDVQKMRHLLYFRGWPLPLRLNNTRVDALMASCGVTDTEELKGKKIKLITAPTTKYGETVLDIMIHHAPVGPNVPADAFVNPYTAQAGRQLGAAGSPTAAALPPKVQERDTRPIGAALAERMLKKIGEEGTELGKILSFAKINDYDLWEAIYGKDVADFPAWTMQSIRQVMDAMKLPSELAGSTQAKPLEIDCPF